MCTRLEHVTAELGKQVNLMRAMGGSTHTTHEGVKRCACVARHLSVGTTRR